MNGLNMSDVTNYMLGSIQVSEVYYGSTKIWPQTPHDYSGDYFTIQSLENNNTISMHPLRNSDEVIEYSINNGAWQSVTLYGVYNDSAQTTIAQLNANDKLRIRHTGSIAELNHQAPPYEDSHNMQIYSTGTFNVYGNIMSLVNGSNFENTTLTEDFEFKALLSGGGTLTRGAKVVNASNLILPSNVTRYCYAYMFLHTITLTSAPALPATTLVEHCYHEMFYGCSSLTTAPDLLASVLPDLCYYHMFYDCSSLNSIKCLATDISAYNCTEGWLVNVANSGTFTKATSMSNWTTGYSGIPSGWTVQNYGPAPHDYSQDYLTFESLENNNTVSWKQQGGTAKTIQYSTDLTTWTSATSSTAGTTLTILNNGDKLYIKGSNSQYRTNNSKYVYFQSTENVNVSGNIMSLIYGDNFTNQYTLSNANVLGCIFGDMTTLISAENLILPATTLSQSCYSEMFSGCTSLTSAPALPATTLANSCYYGMFYGCTSLTAAPELPATTLANSCYSWMFYGCTSLSYIKCLATDISATGCTGTWVGRVNSSGTFIKAASMTSWTTGSDGIPSGWTTVDAS